MVGSPHLVAPIQSYGLHRLALSNDLSREVFVLCFQTGFAEFQSYPRVRLQQVVYFAVLYYFKILFGARYPPKNLRSLLKDDLLSPLHGKAKIGQILDGDGLRLGSLNLIFIKRL